MNEKPEWIQCANCARHVRASDERCPFCERDSRTSALARPAAVVIAALAALAPIESSAESNDRSQRSAQSRMTSAYGSPAPAYGLAPRPEPTPTHDIFVEQVQVPAPVQGRAAAVMRAAIARSRERVRACIALMPNRSNETLRYAVQLSLRSEAGTPIAITVRPVPERAELNASASCVRAQLNNVSWPRPESGVAALRWTYRVQPIRPRR